MTPRSEPVQLDGGLWDPLFSEEVGDLDPLITLKLDDLTHLLVVNESTVASKFLLECFKELLGIVLLGQTLQSGQRLPPVSLLDADVDVILLRTNVFTASKRVSLICKGVEGIEVLHAHAIERKR